MTWSVTYRTQRGWKFRAPCFVSAPSAWLQSRTKVDQVHEKEQVLRIRVSLRLLRPLSRFFPIVPSCKGQARGCNKPQMALCYVSVAEHVPSLWRCWGRTRLAFVGWFESRDAGLTNGVMQGVCYSGHPKLQAASIHPIDMPVVLCFR